MKIIVFSPYYPPHIGGLESHADEFNKYLSEKGVDITVFTPRLPKESPEKEIKYGDVNPHTNSNNLSQAEKQNSVGIGVGVKIIRFPAFEIISNYPLPKFWATRFWQLFLALFKEKFDIVISRTRFFNTSLLALIYAKIRKVSWIHIEHGSDFVKLNSHLKSSVAKFYDYTLGRLVLILANKVVANSQASANFCKKIAPKINCEIIYRGVEIEKIGYAQPKLEIRNAYPDDFIITFIGRLIDGKGVADLINAAKNIHKKFMLFIIGDGPQKEKLEKLSKKLELGDKVKFFGHKKFEEAIAILKISDIFVNPSYTEGLPTTVIEAALCKKAIIATDVGGTSEIITDEKSGFLIEPNNPALLKEKLEILMNNKNLRENLGNSAYLEVVNKFSWEKSIEKYLEIFNEL